MFCAERDQSWLEHRQKTEPLWRILRNFTVMAVSVKLLRNVELKGADDGKEKKKKEDKKNKG